MSTAINPPAPPATSKAEPAKKAADSWAKFTAQCEQDRLESGGDWSYWLDDDDDAEENKAEDEMAVLTRQIMKKWTPDEANDDDDVAQLSDFSYTAERNYLAAPCFPVKYWIKPSWAFEHDYRLSPIEENEDEDEEAAQSMEIWEETDSSDGDNVWSPVTIAGDFGDIDDAADEGGAEERDGGHDEGRDEGCDGRRCGERDEGSRCDQNGTIDQVQGNISLAGRKE